MPISDPYYPSHFIGYTRDELLLSLQLQFEILSHRVLELELGEGARRSPCPYHSASVPPHSSSSHFAHPPSAPAPIPDFDARLLPAKQQISFFASPCLRARGGARACPPFAFLPSSFSAISILGFWFYGDALLLVRALQLSRDFQDIGDHFLTVLFLYIDKLI
ncbi:hypothetical protein Hanom_Chr07g00615731 [Helianthus anomalus]